MGCRRQGQCRVMDGCCKGCKCVGAGHTGGGLLTARCILGMGMGMRVYTSSKAT
jgi:hypothetical protein